MLFFPKTAFAASSDFWHPLSSRFLPLLHFLFLASVRSKKPRWAVFLCYTYETRRLPDVILLPQFLYFGLILFRAALFSGLAAFDEFFI